MKDKISVIVPIYKVEAYLDRCIESIVNQTYRNLEIILVDDGSPDRCPEICDAWAKRDERIKVIHKKNGGVSAARNAGLDLATGDFLAFVDPDDWVSLEWFESLLSGLKKYHADIMRGDYVLINSQGRTSPHYKKIPADRILTTAESAEFMIDGGVVFNLYKRDCLDAVHADRTLSIGEDTDWLIRLLKAGFRFCKIDAGTYFYFQNESSATHRRIDPVALEKFLRKLLKGIDSLPIVSDLKIKILHSHLVYIMGYYAQTALNKRGLYRSLMSKVLKEVVPQLSVEERLLKMQEVQTMESGSFWKYFSSYWMRERRWISFKFKPRKGIYQFVLFGVIIWKKGLV